MLNIYCSAINRLMGVSYNSGNIANYAYTGILNTGILPAEKWRTRCMS